MEHTVKGEVMIDKERLDEIEARARIATRGPWAASKSKWGDSQWGLRDGEGGVVGEVLPHIASVIRDDAHDGDHDWDIYARREDLQDYQVTHHEGIANALFIAHARQDVPDLVAEVRRLRELLDEIGHHFSRHRENYPDPLEH